MRIASTMARQTLQTLSEKSEMARYSFSGWIALTRYLDNNAAERELRTVRSDARTTSSPVRTAAENAPRRFTPLSDRPNSTTSTRNAIPDMSSATSRSSCSRISLPPARQQHAERLTPPLTDSCHKCPPKIAGRLVTQTQPLVQMKR